MKRAVVRAFLGSKSISSLIARFEEKLAIKLSVCQKLLLGEIGSVETVLHILIPHLEFKVIRQVTKPDNTTLRESIFTNTSTKRRYYTPIL